MAAFDDIEFCYIGEERDVIITHSRAQGRRASTSGDARSTVTFPSIDVDEDLYVSITCPLPLSYTPAYDTLILSGFDPKFPILKSNRSGIVCHRLDHQGSGPAWPSFQSRTGWKDR
jgi:hypothetical protein